MYGPTRRKGVFPSQQAVPLWVGFDALDGVRFFCCLLLEYTVGFFFVVLGLGRCCLDFCSYAFVLVFFVSTNQPINFVVFPEGGIDMIKNTPNMLGGVFGRYYWYFSSIWNVGI